LILEFEVARLPGIHADGFRLIADLFYFIYAMSGSKCFAGGIVADECDGHSGIVQHCGTPRKWQVSYRKGSSRM
jgi:hypothetical protein